MKRILIFLTNFHPKVGGIEKVAQQIFTRIYNKKKWDIHIITIDNENPRFEIIDGLNVHRIRSFIYFGGIFSVPNIFDLFRIYYKLIKKQKWDIINTHSRFLSTSFIGIFIAKLNKIKSVHVEHGGGHVNTSSDIINLFSKLYDFTFGRFVLRNASKVIAISEKSCEFVSKLSGIKADLIPNGIDTDFWDPEKSLITQNQIDTEGKIPFLFIGRIVEEKGWKVLINAVISLESKVKESIIIFIAGNGPDMSKLKESIVKYGLTNQVKPLGNISQKQIRDLFCICAYLNPTYASEGNQTTILEAASMNSFIITTDTGNVSAMNMNENQVKIIEKRDAKSLADAITEYVNSPKKSDIRPKIIENYNWEKIVDKYIEVIENL